MRVRLALVLSCLATSCSSTTRHHGFSPPIPDVQAIPELIASPLAPTWIATAVDSGRYLTVVMNRFSENGYPRAFPVETLVVRRKVLKLGLMVDGKTNVEEDRVVTRSTDGGFEYLEVERAVIHVRRDGTLESPDLKWMPFRESPDTSSVSVPSKAVPVDGDLHRVSSDNRFMVAVDRFGRGINVRGETGRFGLLQFYDISNLSHPRRLGPTYEADGYVNDLAVSADGSRIAVQMLDHDRQSRWVIALRRHGKRLESLRLLAPSRDGLQIVSNFLFVGPAESHWPLKRARASVDTIVAFDLTD